MPGEIVPSSAPKPGSVFDIHVSAAAKITAGKVLAWKKFSQVRAFDATATNTIEATITVTAGTFVEAILVHATVNFTAGSAQVFWALTTQKTAGAETTIDKIEDNGGFVISKKLAAELNLTDDAAIFDPAVTNTIKVKSSGGGSKLVAGTQVIGF